MDLIERKRLLEQIDSYWKDAHSEWWKVADTSAYLDGYNRARLDMLHQLSDIVIDAPSVWHKANEKPVKNSIIIFYYFNKETGDDDGRGSQLYNFGSYINGRFVVIGKHGVQDIIQDEDIIAWMYMPVPPKEFYPEGFFE